MTEENIVLQFPEAFFQEEVRCGFRVSATMKRYWAAQLPFENMVLTVPSDADKVLRAYYGDYMVFERNTQDHDYPIYKKELAMLHEKGLWLDVQE